MSTRGSRIYLQNDEIVFHLYNEYHDDCFHLEIISKVKLDGGRVVENNSIINIIVSKYMAEGLRQLLAPLENKDG